MCLAVALLLTWQVEKNKERLKLEQGDDKVKDSQIARLIDMERVVRFWR